MEIKGLAQSLSARWLQPCSFQHSCWGFGIRGEAAPWGSCLQCNNLVSNRRKGKIVKYLGQWSYILKRFSARHVTSITMCAQLFARSVEIQEKIPLERGEGTFGNTDPAPFWFLFCFRISWKSCKARKDSSSPFSCSKSRSIIAKSVPIIAAKLILKDFPWWSFLKLSWQTIAVPHYFNH